MTRFSGAHVVVTGGSSGIGLETARLAAGRGAAVSLVARDPGRLEAAAASIAASAPGAAIGTASIDVTDSAAVRAGFAALARERGPADVLVTAAGLAHPGYFEQLDDAVFRDQMEVDYFGTLHAIRAVVPSMLERRRGHLVLVSSTAGLVGVFGYSAYIPTKYAVRGLAETLRRELKPRGIVVSCVYPPDTDTPGFAAENEIKPAETTAISAAIAPRPAADVATAIVRGVERDRRVITVDVQTALLARAGGLLEPLVHRSMDRTVRKVQGRGRSGQGGSG
ncbi:MAG: SDR family oxidoreductase [Acidimicrobiia bacterium]